MNYIEVTLLWGDRLAIQKDTITAVREFTGPPSKDLVKQYPFLKGVDYCVWMSSSFSGDIFCKDSYEDIMQQLRD